MQKLKTSIIVLLGCLIFQHCAPSAGPVKEKSPADKISEYLTTIESQGFDGAVLVVQEGEILVSDGFGLSDVEKNIRNTDSTIFDIGSITKQFTAAGILKLEMAEKLSVNDLMSKYFANVPDDKKDITLHQLLTHSAGFPGAIGDDYEDISSADFIALAMSKPLMFNPGTGYEYSNVGYSLLAMIIEKVSGQPYETYLHDNLFQPAGMNNTGYLFPKWNGSLIATGYRNDIRWAKPTEKWTSGSISWHLKGNGGILSTVKDMYKWHLALLTGDILSAEAKAKYYTPFVREGEGANSFYAYGWAIFPTPRNTNLVAHNGGNGIFFADFLRYLDEKVTIIVMCNRSTRYANRIASQIAGIIFTPDFVPTYPEGSGIELDQERVLAIGNGFVETIAQPDSAKWESFIRDNFSEKLFGFVSMSEHLKFFRSFHDDLKDAKMATMDISNNIIQVTYETGGDVVLISLELDQLPSGEIKLGGIMVD